MDSIKKILDKIESAEIKNEELVVYLNSKSLGVTGMAILKLRAPLKIMFL